MGKGYVGSTIPKPPPEPRGLVGYIFFHFVVVGGVGPGQTNKNDTGTAICAILAHRAHRRFCRNHPSHHGVACMCVDAMLVVQPVREVLEGRIHHRRTCD